MKVTATKEKITALDFDSIPGNRLDITDRGGDAEKNLKRQILAEPKGKSLLKFCTELSNYLVRSYLVENDAAELRDKVCSNLTVTLGCSEHDAHCMIELALELIHAKVYRRSKSTREQINYLISRSAKVL